MVVRAATVAPGFRMSSFWIWHSYELRCSSRFFRSSNESMCGLNFSAGQLQVLEFKFIPQVGQRPLQSTLQSAFIGRANSTCSCRISPMASCVPEKNPTCVSFSVNSISWSSSNSSSSR